MHDQLSESSRQRKTDRFWLWMNVTPWDRHNGKVEDMAKAMWRECKIREIEKTENFIWQKKPNMIPSSEGNTDNVNVKRWKQREQSRRARCICMCCNCTVYVSVLWLTVIGIFYFWGFQTQIYMRFRLILTLQNMKSSISILSALAAHWIYNIFMLTAYCAWHLAVCICLCKMCVITYPSPGVKRTFPHIPICGSEFPGVE